MLRFGVLIVGCLTFLGLASLAAGPLHAGTPPVLTPVVAAASPTPSPQARPPTVVATPTLSSVLPTATTPPAVLLAPSPTVQALDAPELRAVWVDAFHDGFKTAQQVDELVAWARAANLNALFVQVRRRGDAYYLNSFEPRTEDPDLTPGFDALQYLINKAHQGPQRLQVHAWLATLPIWYRHDAPPLAPNHVFNTHGLTADPADSWLMYRDDGEAWAGNGDGGTYYVDPGNPAAQTYTADVYVNLVRNYDVDGIHLDQVRYFEGDPLHWGYNPTSVARFNAQFHRDPATQPAATDPDWIAWRREQVTALVRRIYTQSKALKPNVAVTAAVVTWGRGPLTDADWQKQAPYAAVLQDWRGWLQKGIVDYVLPMNYFREDGEQAAWFDTWTQWQVTFADRRGVVLGLGSYLNSGNNVLAQLARARALGPLGVALYSYAVPDADLEHAGAEDRLAFAAQLRSIFARPAPVPTLSPFVASSAP